MDMKLWEVVIKVSIFFNILVIKEIETQKEQIPHSYKSTGTRYNLVNGKEINKMFSLEHNLYVFITERKFLDLLKQGQWKKISENCFWVIIIRFRFLF